MFNFLLSSITIWSILSIACAAWQTADDCTGNKLTMVNAAMAEALDIAMYSKYRAQDTDKPRLGNPLQNYLGASSENDEAVLSLVETWMGNVVKASKKPVVGLSGIIIHCSDGFLTNIGTRKFKDTTRGSNSIINLPNRAGATDNACGGFMQGFAIGQTVVLCDDGPNSAFSKSTGGATLGGFRTAGDLTKTNPVIVNGIDQMTSYLSSKILHELMHCTANCANDFTCQFPSVLPDSKSVELYGFKAITGLSAIGDEGPAKNPPTAKDRQHNADSFVLLGISWYLPPYGWKNGAVKSVGSVRRPPAPYPGQPNPPASSNPKTTKRSRISRRAGELNIAF